MKEFIGEFKHLEKLCNDMYGQPHGVTLYINEMEAASHEAGGIAGWSDDFKNLKRLRHIRNNLVHDPEYEPDYDAEDIEYLKDFYRRIIDQQDLDNQRMDFYFLESFELYRYEVFQHCLVDQVYSMLEELQGFFLRCYSPLHLIS